MKFLADESVDFRIVKSLRERGYEIDAIIENNPSIDDDEVLNIAFSNQSILITEDKDFGELAYRLKLPNYGVILIRLSGVSIEHKINLVLDTVKNYRHKLKNRFSVLSKNKLRIK